jgi:hypothetical protein
VEGRLQAAAEDMHRQEMFCHHAEQEVKRVEAIIEVRHSSTGQGRTVNNKERTAKNKRTV